MLVKQNNGLHNVTVYIMSSHDVNLVGWSGKDFVEKRWLR